MRKQTKYVAVLSAAALLAMGASMTSFAAGWEKDEAGAWHYYDKDDDMVTGEWKKDGNKWFYLDDDGNMAVNKWVEDDYYVGEDGAMITNGWVKTLEDDEDVDSPEDTGEHWYYFNAKGKKVTNTKKTIAGKTYHFNDEGKMLTGWQTAAGDNDTDEDATVYYLGGEDEGWETRNEWRWLEKSGIDDDDEDRETGHSVLGCAEDDDCDDEGWYWFDASGKLYHKTGEKTIKGRKFAFNKHGQMLYEWVYNKKVTPATYAMLDKATDGNISIDEMRWYQENGDGANNGARYKGWQYISGSESLNKAGDTNWYYFKDSKPKHADTVKDDTLLNDGSDGVYRKKEKLSWDGKTGTFCFDEFGKMKTGLQYIEGNTYFFNDDGYMQTGKVSNVEEADGDTFSYYFQTKNTGKGHGITGEKDGYLYFMGKRLEADDDYRIYKVSRNYYIVNSKGKLQKSFNKKDVELATGDTEEDKYLSVNNKNYRLTVKKTATGDLDLTDSQTKFINDNAVIPHIQLDSTDNYILEDAILKPDETDEAKGYDFLNQANLTKALSDAAKARQDAEK
ncbi:Glucan-binding domain-containing protein (YG repeat) [[Clostridium] aminophilum]|uniref:Glucan-binding domain-containing protein (YG repeat) n=2 Tax=[Clostridium] aminophilum TaxID=1526 RepID=A0A1I0INV6_9FIRM|nr:hypothetical protein [[Clostridium] aminophilum]SET98026.1 Glucan-binding domain-containing protein (YG repeat) [[Clostridium] aminophilum]